jgi:hypothetical protein
MTNPNDTVQRIADLRYASARLNETAIEGEDHARAHRIHQHADELERALAPASAEPVIALLIAAGHVTEDKVQQAREIASKTPGFTAPPPSVPAGYRLVPVEPTEAMVAATDHRHPLFGPPERLTAENERKHRERVHAARRMDWSEMLAAAPEPPQ